MIGIGTDLVDIDRFREVLTRTREFGRDCFATQNSPTPTQW